MTRDSNVADRICLAFSYNLDFDKTGFEVARDLRDAIASALTAAREEGRLAGLGEMGLTEDALSGEIADALQICRIPASRDAAGEHLSDDKLREIGRKVARFIRSRQTPTGTGEMK